MYLIIDLSEQNKIHLVLFNEKNKKETIREGRNADVLVCLDKFLKKNKIKKEKLEGVGATIGKGGFTSTRMAVVITNTFGYVLQIPVLAVKVGDVEDTEKIIEKFKKTKKGIYVSAKYGGEPNLGRKRVV